MFQLPETKKLAIHKGTGATLILQQYNVDMIMNTLQK
jgi:hypothetical protein